jgi:hypothetical protein
MLVKFLTGVFLDSVFVAIIVFYLIHGIGELMIRNDGMQLSYNELSVMLTYCIIVIANFKVL